MDLKRIKQAIDNRQKSDTTKMYNREEFIDTINKITRGEIKPKNVTATPKQPVKAKTTYKVIDKKGQEFPMSKEDFEGFVKRRNGKA
jgi:hypothetical protein